MLASGVFQTVLQQLRSLRVELTGTADSAGATRVSRVIAECEKWITEAEDREKGFLPYAIYRDQFHARHIQPFLDACPAAAGAVQDEVLLWLAEQTPVAGGAAGLEDELDDALDALVDAVDDGDTKGAVGAARVIMPLARRLEAKRLKTGDYVALTDAADAERQLAERIIRVAYPAVTGRPIRLRADTAHYSLGGYVRVDGDYQDSPEWFAICDRVADHDSNVLRAIYNSSLTVPSRWAKARILLYTDGELRPFTTTGFEWCSEILDERTAIKLFILKCTQVGISTTLFIRVLWELDYCGRDAIYYLPDESATKKLNIRLENLIEGSPYLALRIDATQDAKRVGMATLHLEGSRGISAGRSTPAAVIVLDEYDIFDSANAEEIARRLTGTKRSLEICASTPRYPGCGIDGLVERYGAQREAFVAPCPYCLASVRLDYPDSFHREGEYENDPRCSESYVKCPSCGGRFDATTKAAMMASGAWELLDPTQQRGNVRVFQGLNHLYSNTVSPEDFARASLRTGDAAVREFNNSNLGRPYIEERGQILLRTLAKSISPGFSMAEPVLPRAIELDKPARLLLIDQGRPHSAIVAEYRIGKREDWHSSPLDRFMCRVLWAEKTDAKVRLDEVACLWQVWSCIIDADPDDTLPGFLLHSPHRHLHNVGYVVAVRSLDVWNTASGIESPSVSKDDPLPRLSLVNVHRTQYYAAAIRRANAGNLVLPSDISNQFIDEVQNMILTHVPDPTGSPRLYAKAREGKPHDYLSCLQLGEVGLELLTGGRIGVVMSRPDTFRI